MLSLFKILIILNKYLNLVDDRVIFSNYLYISALLYTDFYFLHKVLRNVCSLLWIMLCIDSLFEILARIAWLVTSLREVDIQQLRRCFLPAIGTLHLVNAKF